MVKTFPLWWLAIHSVGCYYLSYVRLDLDNKIATYRIFNDRMAFSIKERHPMMNGFGLIAFASIKVV